LPKIKTFSALLAKYTVASKEKICHTRS